MLDAVVLLGALCVVEVVERADQVSGDAADALDRLVGGFVAVAVRALVADDAGVAADRVAVDRVVDRAVADAGLLHAADELLKGLDILAGVAVQLDIGDVAAVGQRVVRRFQPDLLKGVDVEVDRDVERIGIILAVGDAGDGAEAFAVDLDKPSGQPLGGGGDEREIEVALFALGVHPGAHVADDLQAEVLGILALAVVLADQGDQRFRQTDEADGQGAVFENLADLILRPQLVRVDPHALPHQEGEVEHLLLPLDAEAVEQLLNHQIDALVEQLEEEVDVFVGKDAQSRQVDRGVGEVAAAGGDFPGRVVDVGGNPGAAAHVGDLGFGAAGPVILQVKRRVQKGEVGEQPLGADLAGQLEQVVVRVAGVVVDPLLDLEDVDGEDGGLAVSKARLLGQQHIFDDHPALGGGVGAVVEGAERRLRARAGVHGVQIQNQPLHRLVGGAFGFLIGIFLRKALGAFGGLFLVAERLHQQLALRLHIAFVRLEGGDKAALRELCKDRLQRGVRRRAEQLAGLLEVLAVAADVGLAHAGSHVEVELRHALAAVLVVLVGLDGGVGQSGVAADVLRLMQVAVAAVEAALEQLGQVDLAAGSGQREKVEVVDVDIAAVVGAGVLRVEHKHLVEGLGPLRAVFEHGAHGGVAVDVGVFALDVVFGGALKGQVLIDLHQLGVHLPHAGALGAVEDVLLGGAGVAGVDQHLFHHVLNLLDGGGLGGGIGLLQPLLHLQGKGVGGFKISAANRGRRLEDCLGNLLHVVGGGASIALDDCAEHEDLPFLSARPVLSLSEKTGNILRCGMCAAHNSRSAKSFPKNDALPVHSGRF